jgi:hypothetical protein
MPPPGGMAGMDVSFLGFSATIASVVIKRPAMDDPSCSAMRTTLVGSMIPLHTLSERFLKGLICPCRIYDAVETLTKTNGPSASDDHSPADDIDLIVRNDLN